MPRVITESELAALPAATPVRWESTCYSYQAQGYRPSVRQTTAGEAMAALAHLRSPDAQAARYGHKPDVTLIVR